MEKSRKVDYSELAKLILEGYRLFPEVFFEHFCLENSFRYAGFRVNIQTAKEIKSIFKGLIEKYQLSNEEMKLITADGQGCCANPVRQLARRWLVKNCPDSNRWINESPMIWRRNEVLIIDFSDSMLDLEIAECLFWESGGAQKLRLIEQLKLRNFFPIVDGLNCNLDSNLNASIPEVYVGMDYWRDHPKVRLDLNSVLHQCQRLEYLADSKTIIGWVNFRAYLVNIVGYYIWESDEAGIYRARHYDIAYRLEEEGVKSVEILSTFLKQRMVLRS